MKSYEILPADMTGSAMKGAGDVKEPKPHEILPEAGTAAQGLVGWTKGASSIARGVPTPKVFSKQAIGLSYDPVGALPTQGGATVPRTGKVYEILPAGMTGRAQESKPYEIVPGAGVMGRGLGSKSGGCGGKPGGCGCGGKCGGGTGHDHHPSGMKKSGGCGPSKAGGCGCGGKCGGSDGGIILPPSAGILLPRSWSSDIPSDVSQISEGYSPGWLADWSPWGAAGWRFEGNPSFPISPLGQTGCGDLQKAINDLYERIRHAEDAPDPPSPACAPPSALWPCNDTAPNSPEETDCVCFRGAQGLLTLSRGASVTCPPGVNTNPNHEQAAAARSAADDICNRMRVVPALMNELYRLLGEQLRRHCPLDPRFPWPRPDPTWCRRHPRICFRINCLRNQDSPLCQDWRLPDWLRIRPPPKSIWCETYLQRFREIERAYETALNILRALREARNILGRSAPGVASLRECLSTLPTEALRIPACDLISNATASLQASLDSITLGVGREADVQVPLASAAASGRNALNSLRARKEECESATRVGSSSSPFNTCDFSFSQNVWDQARDALESRIAEVLLQASDLRTLGNSERENHLDFWIHERCVVPPELTEPST